VQGVWHHKKLFHSVFFYLQTKIKIVYICVY
jgi:hypothetical protein